MSFYFKRKLRIFVISLFLIICSILVFTFYVIPEKLFPYKYINIVQKYSSKYDINSSLVTSIINVESGFDKDAISSKGAKGLMQIMDITGNWAAEEIGLENFTTDMLFDPEINIQIGCWYIDKLNKQFNYKKNTVLAAYNAGSGNVSKWLNNLEYSNDKETLYEIPFEQTKSYVKKVNINEKIYKSIYDLE